MRVQRTKYVVLFSMWVLVPYLSSGQAAQRGDGAAAVTFATPTPPAPLFFGEPWRQPSPLDASTNFEPERPVTPAALTNTDLELHLYDPHAKEIAGFRS